MLIVPVWVSLSCPGRQEQPRGDDQPALTAEFDLFGFTVLFLIRLVFCIFPLNVKKGEKFVCLFALMCEISTNCNGKYIQNHIGF